MNAIQDEHQEDEVGAPIKLPLSKYLNEAQVDALNQPVPAKSLLKRKGGGNKDFAYVDPRYVTAQLNRIFGFDGWSRETLSCVLIKDEPTSVEVYTSSSTKEPKAGFCITAQATVRLTIHLIADDGSERKIVRDGVGVAAAAEVDKFGQSKGDLMERTIKAAETDALKRAAKTLGKVFGLNIKESDQLEEIAVTSPDAAPAAPKPAEPARVTRPTVAAPPKAAPQAAKPAAAPAAPKPAEAAPAAEQAPAVEAEPAKPAEAAKPAPAKPEPAKAEAPKPEAAKPQPAKAEAAPESDASEELEPIENGRSEAFFKATSAEMAKWSAQEWIEHSKQISKYITEIKTLDDAKLLIPAYERMKKPASGDKSTSGWHNTLVSRTMERIEGLKTDPETGGESFEYIEVHGALADVKIQPATA